jgi:A/G-specific adenine glycosylase
VKQSNFASALLDWYKINSRDLPWRLNRVPYNVWVSEIMLQQTRVETVIPYYSRWMTLFPTVHDLAGATQQDVLSTWEGLGYYSRARNLHRAAQLVVQDMDGKLPSDPKALRKLPGIGRSTAGAIASIAFGLDEPALDGNIRRVLARYFNLIEPAHSSQGIKLLWDLASENLPVGKAGEYNQAIMDLGAAVCTPRAPRCSDCPINTGCQALALGVQEDRPVSSAKKSIPHYTVTAAVITKNQHSETGFRVLISQRPPDGLLGGLWEFPGGKLQPGEDLEECVKREILEELGVPLEVIGPLGVYRHAYTHFRVTLHAYHCQLSNGNQPESIQVRDFRWITLAELNSFPMGKLDRQISRTLISMEWEC